MTQFDYLRYEPWPLPNKLLKDLERSTHVTQTIISKLDHGQETVALLPGLNPPHWEFGHLIWFHEFWVHRKGAASNPSFLARADALFNSSEMIHDDRWQVQIPSIDILMNYFSNVMERTFAILRSGTLSPEQAYFIQLALYHEDMHNEAFAYMWQSLGYVWPLEQSLGSIQDQQKDLEPRYIHIPQSQFKLGSTPNTGFIFDNEKWQHEVLVPNFSISSHAVSSGEYVEFLRSLNDAGISYVEHQPTYWKKEGDTWFERFFDQWRELDLNAPVRHISAHNAEQYCLWKGVRLPTENELSLLMTSAHEPWQPSSLWEWTSSTFKPFEGFSSDPYQDYSAPWFDSRHRVLKGWSVYTPDYLRRPQFRNFYLPSRSDFFCGFRTCLA
ncbi:SUMF1/EgtB/PvdO family nonheme iron enzyme [Polynucleobacter sp. AP-Nino-20-G2]|uniref:SUMF1/EgtB/PvdO family nonheme iron enzyme n=1 Tax=Polynucleobacter sp. AP-Nino-20-G2 TaxID=2576917 RepID=UPI001BFDC320|nr:SUMF1/EgtB/PvdO family nonheme iron enzyme [Polynucleobacter sp. AP-Nino-20-G2]QWE16250.1 SUMF1/EgtB/PvdO family nonheme iron enzyme [Polynucleobacter sp. AP-Nino-20-G2]